MSLSLGTVGPSRFQSPRWNERQYSTLGDGLALQVRWVTPGDPTPPPLNHTSSGRLVGAPTLQRVREQIAQPSSF